MAAEGRPRKITPQAPTASNRANAVPSKRPRTPAGKSSQPRTPVPKANDQHARAPQLEAFRDTEKAEYRRADNLSSKGSATRR